MLDQGLVVGTWGNISQRQDNLLAITPSGMDYEILRPEDIVIMDVNGNVVEGERRPSTEFHLHCLIYQHYPEAKAVVHVHSPYASAFAVARRPIPPILEETAQMLGGEVRVAEYAAAGSPELARAAVRALADRQACLLANHGLVGLGRNVYEALRACLVAEKSARVTILAGLLGEVKVLPEDDVVALRQGFAFYGQPK